MLDAGRIVSVFFWRVRAGLCRGRSRSLCCVCGLRLVIRTAGEAVSVR